MPTPICELLSSGRILMEPLAAEYRPPVTVMPWTAMPPRMCCRKHRRRNLQRDCRQVSNACCRVANIDPEEMFPSVTEDPEAMVIPFHRHCLRSEPDRDDWLTLTEPPELLRLTPLPALSANRCLRWQQKMGINSRKRIVRGRNSTRAVDDC